jgi:hypothetical protein
MHREEKRNAVSPPPWRRLVRLWRKGWGEGKVRAQTKELIPSHHERWGAQASLKEEKP